MAEAYQSFTDLLVWKKARALKKEIGMIVHRFPTEEKYRLSDQLIRCSRGINSCIAEGHGRFTAKDQNYFCMIARGSLSETLNHLIDAYDCKYISAKELADLKSKIDEVGKLLNGYIGYIRRRKF